LIETSVPNKGSDPSCICVLGISIWPLPMICLSDFRTVPTVW